ncbi:hypothetical protein [Streptomyces sp. S.PB5]|uniref:hypothetical protein n=1 Tax=Streptomyces sp. S.PB5 TaxID=3020844 RepID=UPI0025AF001D|nr:hypothetical protein [Streptomyces sp. S.PB5]MDN3022784.1 hypothetical protein [Streptomyces sp. S.PB5]
MAAGTALALSAAPALASAPTETGAPPAYWGQPVAVSEEQMPYIERESSGAVRFGLAGTQDSPTQVNRLEMAVFAPEHTRFVTATLNPVAGTPGGWQCKMALGETPMETGGDRMVCATEYQGALPASGQTWQWDTTVTVPKEFLCEWAKSTNGWFAVRAHAADGSGAAWSKSGTFGLRTSARPVQAGVVPTRDNPFPAAPCALSESAEPVIPAPVPAAPEGPRGPVGLGGIGGLLGGGLLGGLSLPL